MRIACRITKATDTQSEYVLLLLFAGNNAYATRLTEGLSLTFKNRASYIWDGRTDTFQMLHFIYFFFQQA